MPNRGNCNLLATGLRSMVILNCVNELAPCLKVSYPAALPPFFLLVILWKSKRIVFSLTHKLKGLSLHLLFTRANLCVLVLAGAGFIGEQKVVCNSSGFLSYGGVTSSLSGRKEDEEVFKQG